jgi:hypothetical protein
VWFDVDCKSTSTGVEAYWNALMQYAITKEPTCITILLYIYMLSWLLYACDGSVMSIQHSSDEVTQWISCLLHVAWNNLVFEMFTLGHSSQ